MVACPTLTPISFLTRLIVAMLCSNPPPVFKMFFLQLYKYLLKRDLSRKNKMFCLRTIILCCTQDDESTPVHLACTQGSLDIIKMMFDQQPEKAKRVIHLCDIQGMLPLHRAALFDHVNIVKYLMEMVYNL